MGIKRAFRKIWSFQERNLKDGIAKGEKMAYYSSPKRYEIATGKIFTTHCPCIHRTGFELAMKLSKRLSSDSLFIKYETKALINSFFFFII